ncbi:MAG: MFS transporter [Alphaproteobacteria bacterium]
MPSSPTRMLSANKHHSPFFQGAFLWLSIALFTSYLSATYGFGVWLFPAIAPEIMKTIDFSYQQMGIATASAQMAFFIFAIASGYITNWIGELRLSRIGVLIAFLSLGGLIIAKDFWLISIFLVLLGGSAAVVWIPMVMVAKQFFPKKHRGKALVIISSGPSYGIFINSILIHYLLDNFGWRSLWLATCLIAFFIYLLSLVMFRQVIKSSAIKNKKTIATQKSPSIIAALKSQPRNMTLIIIFMLFLNGLTCLPYLTYLSSWLVDEKNFDIKQTADLWRILSMVGMASGILMALLTDKISIKRTLILTYIILSLSLICLIATSGGMMLLPYLSVILFSLSFYPIYGLVPAYITRIYHKNHATVFFSFGNIALGMGAFLGNGAGGILKDMSGTFLPIYMIILLGALLSILLGVMMKNEQRI